MTRAPAFIAPPTPRSTEETRAIDETTRQRISALRSGGVTQLVSDAVQNQWLGAWAYSQFRRRAGDVDPDWELTEDRLKILAEGLDDNLIGEFENATSAAHAMRIREVLLGEQAMRNRLAAAGWQGGVMQLAAAIIDPVAIGADAATFGLAAPAIYGSKASRLARVVRMGLVTGTTQAGIEAYIASQDPTRDWTDVVQAFAIAGGIGAGATRLADRRLFKTFNTASNRLQAAEIRQAIEASGAALTPKGQSVLDRLSAPTETRATVESLIGEIRADLSPDEIDSVIASLSRLELDDAAEELAIRTEDLADAKAPPAAKESATDAAAAAAKRATLFDEARLGDQAATAAEERAAAVTATTDADGLVTVQTAETPASPGDWLDEIMGAVDDGPLPGLEPPTRSRVRENAEAILALREADKAGEAALQAEIERLPGLFDEDRLEALLGHIETVDGELADRIYREAERGGTLLPKAGIPAKHGAPAGLPDFDPIGAGTAVPARQTGWTGFLQRLRFSFGGAAQNSDSPLSRFLGRVLARDIVTDGTEIVGEAATEWIARSMAVIETRLLRQARRRFREWHKRTNGTFEDFQREIALAWRRGGSTTSDPDVAAILPHMQAVLDDVRQVAIRHKVPGFANLPYDPQYVPRIHSLPAIQRMIATLESAVGPGRGLPLIEQLYAKAILASPGNTVVKARDAKRIAKGYLRTILSLDDLTDVERARLTNGSLDPVTLSQELITKGLATPDDARAIARLLTHDPLQGKISRSAQRLSIDETTSISTVGNGGKRITISIEDTLENNAFLLTQSYARQVLGEAAMQGVYRSVHHHFGEAVDSIVGLQRLLKKEGAGKVAQDAIDTLHRVVLGKRPLPTSSRTDPIRARMLQRLRAVQYIRVMNQVGIAQIPEAGQIVAEAGIGAMLRQIPAMRHLFSIARSGRLSHPLLRELEASVADGADTLRHGVIDRFDDTLESQGRVEWTGFDHGVRRMQQVTNAISLMGPINTFLQRMAMASGVQAWADHALRGRAFGVGRGRFSARRMAQIGLTPADAKRIGDQLKTHATTRDGIFGRSVFRMNMHAWDDQGAAALFTQALSRWSKRVIQQNDIGSMPRFLTNEYAKTLFQFRTFMFQAWEAQFLNRLASPDLTAFVGLMPQLFLASLAYMGQTYVNALGRDDQDEYLDERLSLPRIAAASFQRTGASSMIPGGVDTVLSFMGYGPAFAYGRTTELESNLIAGSPAVDFLSNLRRGLFPLIRAPLDDDYDVSQVQIRSLLRTLPFQNTLGVRNVLNAIVAPLPERSE